MIDGFRKFFLTKLVNESGNAISKSNPLPVGQIAGTLNTQSAIDGVTYKASVTCQALSSNYSSSQLFNPVGSGKQLIIVSLFGFQNVATSGRFYRHISNTQLSTAQSGAIAKTKSNQADSVALCKYENIAALTTNTNQFGTTSTAITPPGVSIFPSANEIVVIDEGFGLNVEFQNTNTQTNVTFIYYEIDA